VEAWLKNGNIAIQCAFKIW